MNKLTLDCTMDIYVICCHDYCRVGLQWMDTGLYHAVNHVTLAKILLQTKSETGCSGSPVELACLLDAAYVLSLACKLSASTLFSLMSAHIGELNTP